MNESKPHVVYWNNIPAPYMVERFNALVDRGSLDFEAWFSDRIEPGRSWNVDESTWRFRYRYLPVTHIAGYNLHWPLPVASCRPDILISLYATPSFLTGWLIAKLRGIKTAFWVEITFDRWIKRNAVKESIKKWVFPRVDAIVTVGKDGQSFATKYGASPEKIYFAPHVIDATYYRTECLAATLDRDRLRSEHHLHGTTFIYVGRLWVGKGVKVLLDAIESVQRQSSEEVSLLLVGDGSEEAKLRHHCVERGIRNVVFTGFKQKAELSRYYAMADAFVFPTLGDPYGLVVNEAMACSLPVISTSAAGEIHDRIEEGVNGYIVPPENSRALADRMLKLVANPELRKRMGHLSAEKIKGHTPEKWAEDFERVVHNVLGLEVK